MSTPQIELERLRAFAAFILQEFWEGAPDGCAIQDRAAQLGLLVPVTVTEPCGENCNCAEWDDFPMTCYRRHESIRNADDPRGDPAGGDGYTWAGMARERDEAVRLLRGCMCYEPRQEHMEACELFLRRVDAAGHRQEGGASNAST